MKYKANYQPSFLLDPVSKFLSLNFQLNPFIIFKESNEFYPYDHCNSLLDKFRWCSFSRSCSIKQPLPNDENNSDEDYDDEDDQLIPNPPPPGFLKDEDLSNSILNNLKILDNRSMKLFTYFVSNSLFHKDILIHTLWYCRHYHRHLSHKLKI